MADNDLTARIQARLDALGLSEREASIAATGSDGTIRMIRTGRTTNPRIDTLEKIARVLRVRTPWLQSGEGPMDFDSDNAERRPSEVRDAGIELRNVGMLPKDVPVLGTVAGSELGKGAFQFTAEVIDYVRRPFGLLGAKDVYALYVEGESMVPKYEPGDLVFVHPHRRPRGGDYIVIQEPDTDNGGPRGYIKRLVSLTPQWIKTQQFNPATNIDFKNRSGTIIHKVMTEGELYGI
jgi:phage repressor protein C with HTH and peptisase S24 domain